MRPVDCIDNVQHLPSVKTSCQLTTKSGMLQANGNAPHAVPGQLSYGSHVKQAGSPTPLSSQFSGFPDATPAPPLPLQRPALPAPPPSAAPAPTSNGNTPPNIPGLGLDLADLIGGQPSSNGDMNSLQQEQPDANGGPPQAAGPAAPLPPPPEPNLEEGPYRAAREGYPMAAPTTTTLQATRRATR